MIGTRSWLDSSRQPGSFRPKRQVLWSIPTGQLPSSRPIRNLREYVEILSLPWTKQPRLIVIRSPKSKTCCTTQWRKGLLQIRPISHLPADTTGWTLQKAPGYQHTERAISLQPTAIWGVPIFQRIIETLLHDIPNVVVYIDDILISDATEDEHLMTLDQVLDKLEQVGPRLKQCKCELLTSSVVYLGHRIDQHGLAPYRTENPGSAGGTRAS